jgi:cell division protein FtsW
MSTAGARGLDPAAIGTYDRRGQDRPAKVEVRDRWRMSGEARALVLVTAVLLAFGLATLYSASAIVAMKVAHSDSFFIRKQLTGALAGIVVFALVAKLDAEKWRKWAWPIMVLSIFMMLLTVLPFTEHIAPRINGSRRFLLGGSIQPSEFAKLAVIVWTSMLLVKKQEAGTLGRFGKGLMPFLVVVGVLALLGALEPDLSIAMTFVLIMSIILFAGGVRIGHFIMLALIAIPVLWHKAEKLQYVVLRMKSFLDPGNAPAMINYQLKQSLVAVGSGGLFGTGFGKGMQQWGFLPFPYSDFIGGNIGEEWGFVGLTALTIVYGLYAWLGFRIAARARTPFQKMMAVGVTTTMVLTAYLHIGVVVGLLPTTGLTLPFISYGRSNLVLSMLMTGMLVNVGSERQRVVGEHATDPLRS